MNTKEKLRNYFLDQRNNLHKQKSSKAKKQVSEQITTYLKKRSGIWASYRPVNTELDPCMIESDNKHLVWVYPKIKGDLLEFHQPLDVKNIWQKNRWGIEEPSDTSSKVIPIKQIEGIFCPALAVDLKGNRLGYGKGYYDRILSHFKGHKIALVFSAQVSQQILPTTKKDVAMNWILTENNFWGCHP